ncbi:DUF6506 family protein [Neomoorella thermoacetica]|uniref:DUF6506 family protein n=1 Tax=Neomoorella thermoacetica TaxID=1525 RepID=UPI0004717762
MALKIAFMFVASQADPVVHQSKFSTPEIELQVIGVGNYTVAEEWARKLVAEGVKAIELCAGFGHEGVARIVRAVKGKAIVGVVRFDNHPGLEGKSGDEVFS